MKEGGGKGEREGKRMKIGGIYKVPVYLSVCLSALLSICVCRWTPRLLYSTVRCQGNCSTSAPVRPSVPGVGPAGELGAKRMEAADQQLLLLPPPSLPHYQIQNT